MGSRPVSPARASARRGSPPRLRGRRRRGCRWLRRRSATRSWSFASSDTYITVWINPMAPPLRTPRTTWVQEGLRALADGGPDAVRIEPLARALGVTKGGFYWHFNDRRALLDEMLDTWERVSVDEVIEVVEGGGGDARARLGRLFELATSKPEVLRIDLAVRDWARRDPKVAKHLRRVDNR